MTNQNEPEFLTEGHQKSLKSILNRSGTNRIKLCECGRYFVATRKGSKITYSHCRQCRGKNDESK